jgi:S1-C subfamily serine protease
MYRCLSSLLLLAGLAGAGFAPKPTEAAGGRPNAIERYGLSGFIQPIGLHHGFHIERIAPDSAAEKDRLLPHDIIVRVDGEEIRSLEHLRSLLTDVDEDDGEAELTILRVGSLEHHIIKCHIKPRAEEAPARKASPTAPREDDHR